MLAPKKLILILVLCHITFWNYGQSSSLKVINKTSHSITFKLFAKSSCHGSAKSTNSMTVKPHASIDVPPITSSDFSWFTIESAIQTGSSQSKGVMNYPPLPTDCHIQPNHTSPSGYSITWPNENIVLQ